MKKVYPARIVGEFDRLDKPVDWDRDIPKPGDCALVHNYPSRDTRYTRLLIRCGCGEVDSIAVRGDGLPHPPETVVLWELQSREPLTLSPSVRVTNATMCHLTIEGGRMNMLDDTTAPLL